MAGNEDHLTPAEMRVWHEQQIRDLTRAFQLRVKESTDLVTAYAQGQITPAEAMERLGQYDQRWGEPIRGIETTDRMTDEEILERLDSAHHIRRVKPRGESENRQR